MPSVDSRRTVKLDQSIFSHRFGDVLRAWRTKFVRLSRAAAGFTTRELGFAVICQLAQHAGPPIRFLLIGSRLCAPLLSHSWANCPNCGPRLSGDALAFV
jgi:hypothetical protein